MGRRAVWAVFAAFALSAAGFAAALPWTRHSVLALVASGLPVLFLAEACFWAAARHDHDPDEGYYAFLLRCLALALAFLAAGAALVALWAGVRGDWLAFAAPAGAVLAAVALAAWGINRAFPHPAARAGLPVW